MANYIVLRLTPPTAVGAGSFTTYLKAGVGSSSPSSRVQPDGRGKLNRFRYSL